jgi:hypothetical protein
MWVARTRDSADPLALDPEDGSRDNLQRLETQLFYGRYCDAAARPRLDTYGMSLVERALLPL